MMSTATKLGYLLERVKGEGYDLILTGSLDYDGNRGESGGIDAIRTIREFDSSTPIYMIVSGNGSKEQALQSGAKEYIDKSNVEELEKVVAEHCESKQDISIFIDILGI